MFQKFILGLLLWPSLSFAMNELQSFSAKILLPSARAISPHLSKLSMAWSPECTDTPTEEPTRIRLRTLNGAMPLNQLGCESQLPSSAENWDTLAIQIRTANRIWTAEIRESAELFVGKETEGRLQVDLAALSLEEPVDQLMLADVRLDFASPEQVLCGGDWFGMNAMTVNPRIEGSSCYIERVEGIGD